MKKRLALIIILPFIFACQKEKLKGGPRNGRYVFSCTVRTGQPYDTLIAQNSITDKYELCIGEKNEVTGHFTATFLKNDEVLHHFLITSIDYETEDPYDGIKSSFYSDGRPQGFTTQGLFVDGVAQPARNPFYLQIVDFPFPGWNRFMLEE